MSIQSYLIVLVILFVYDNFQEYVTNKIEDPAFSSTEINLRGANEFRCFYLYMNFSQICDKLEQSIS